MKVKKVLSLALAIVMVFTMIPAQLILSNANRMGDPEAYLGSALQYNLKVSQESGKTGKNAAYNGLIKVEFQVKVDYTDVPTEPKDIRPIAMLDQVFSFDTNVLAPVSSANSGRGTSTLEIAKTNAGAPNYSWSKSEAGDNFALFAENILDEDEETFKYGINQAGFSYNETTERMYVDFLLYNSDSCIWLENEWQTAGYLYLKPAEGATFAAIFNAIKLAEAEELCSDNGCKDSTIEQERQTAGLNEGARFVAVAGMTNALPADPVEPTTVKIKFNWKAVEEGTVVDKTTGEVEYDEGDPVTAPENSENDYSTAEYDYEFTGWSPALAEGATATEDTVYTAQYQKKPVNKDDLNTEYLEDKGLVKEDYDEKVPGAWDAFQQALATAKSVLDNADASKVDVANALAALEAAMANLTPKTPQSDFTITFNWKNGANTADVTTAPNAKPQVPQGAEDNYFSADHKTEYIFAGWKDAAGTVYASASEIPEATADAVYTAQYTEKAVTVEITFDVKGEKTTINKPYGDMVTLADAPIVSDYYSTDGDTHYIFEKWEPDFEAATAAKTYTAKFQSEPVYADYKNVTAAIANANAAIADAGEEYEAMYTPESRAALQRALNAVETEMPQSQQATVDAWAGAINAAVTGLTRNTITLKFITHESPAGIEKDYLYGDAVTDVPAITDYTDAEGFKWTANGWDKNVPATAKTADTFTAQYTKEDAASTAALQQAVSNAISKRDGGDWTDDSVAALNTALAKADAYPSTREYPASAQAEIDRITAEINTAADNLTPKGATTFDVTFNWTGDNGEDKSSTTSWANGTTPTAPAGSENGYETQDYTYTFKAWTPAITAVDGANQSYTATYNDPQPKSADTTALEQAIAAAQAKQAETDYAAKYTDTAKAVLDRALSAAQAVIDSNPLPSQQGTVDNATQAINNALDNMTVNTIIIVFKAAEFNTDVERVLNYGDAIEAPALVGYSEGDYDYTPKAGAAAWAPAVPATATANAEYVAQYDKSELRKADYTANDAAVEAANDILNTPNADKIYTEDYLAGIQNALQQNVDQGLGRTQQDAVDAATATIINAIANPQYINYTVRFLDDDNTTVLATGTYNYGDTVTAPTDPEKAPTVDKTFTFAGWTPALTAVTGNQDYVATYTDAPREYTVTYVYHGGQATEAVAYGNLPQNPPTVPTYYEHGIKYTFARWNTEFAPVEGPQTYTAVYEQEEMPAVSVTFRYAVSLADVKDGHLTDDTQSVPYGDMPVEPTPQSFVDGDTTYKFDGWDKDVVAATDDAVYTAIYTPVTDFTPDMSEIEELVSRYNQMVRTGEYNKDDLKAVKAYIDEIYDTTFTSQDEVNEMAANLKALEDACRRIDVSEEETKKREVYSRRFSRTARTGDNATLVVMSVILVSSIGIAVISLKKRRENI